MTKAWRTLSFPCENYSSHTMGEYFIFHRMDWQLIVGIKLWQRSFPFSSFMCPLYWQAMQSEMSGGNDERSHYYTILLLRYLSGDFIPLIFWFMEVSRHMGLTEDLPLIWTTMSLNGFLHASSSADTPTMQLDDCHRCDRHISPHLLRTPRNARLCPRRFQLSTSLFNYSREYFSGMWNLRLTLSETRARVLPCIP